MVAKMAFFTYFLIQVSLLAGVFSFEDMTVAELSKKIGGPVFQPFDSSMGDKSTMLFQLTCEPAKITDVKFLLYTRKNPVNPVTLDGKVPTQIDPAKKVIVLIHGWISGPKAYGFPEMVKAYLQRYDCNLILIDWSKVAWNTYGISQCKVPSVAQVVAYFLCQVSERFNYSLADLHIVGHSLGGHLAGFTGKYTSSMCSKKVGRITGLDPAGPFYRGNFASGRLDSGDALFVDVIHTNSIQYGYLDAIGHVDYYVNCGALQPGCPAINMTDLETTLASVVSCSHLRALDLMTESVNSGKFKAKSCSGCPLICISDILGASYNQMGEDCPVNARGRFWIPTNKASPFAQDCKPFSSGCT